MGIASLLQRAKAVAASAYTEVDAAWPPGARVELLVPGIVPVRGWISFVDGPWVHWSGEDGREHASKADALRRL